MVVHRLPRSPRAGHGLGVAGEVLGRGPGGPAALVLQDLRQVPVVEGDHRLDAVAQQLVHQLLVVEAGLADRARPSGCTRGQATENQ